MANPENVKSLKILLIGGQCVGKTSLLKCYNHNNYINNHNINHNSSHSNSHSNDTEFNETYIPTSNSDFSVKSVMLGEVELSIQLWDIGATATMGKVFFRGTQGIVLVVDVSTPTSHSQLKELYDKVASLANFADNRFPCVLVGNKVDVDPAKRFVSKERLQSFADSCRFGDDAAVSPIRVMEASARTGFNVAECFHTIIEATYTNPARTLSAAAVAALCARREEMGVDATFYDGMARGRLASDGTTAKVIVAGASAVGKTLLLQRYAAGPKAVLSQAYEPTIGADFRLVEVPARSSTIKLQIWDSSGDVKQQKLSRALYKGSHCLILVFDITSKDSFNALDQYWMNYIEYSDTLEPDAFPAVLVGNKSDKSDKRAVQMEEILDWCSNKRPRRPVTYIECSAWRNISVEDIFVVAGDYIYEYLNADANEDEEDADAEDAVEDGGDQVELEDGEGVINDQDTNAGKYSETPTDPRAEPFRSVGNPVSESNYAAGVPSRLHNGSKQDYQRRQQQQQQTCFDFPGMIKRMFCS